MSSKHYDIAIIGGSLTARITAALLAKHGCKVIFLKNREASAPAWFHSSIFLEKLLGVLGGRSCFVAQRSIQVIAEKSRVTLSNDVLLENELNREFGFSGPAVHDWLSELHYQGTRLEELFWENKGLPWASFKTSAHFKLLCMRRRVNLTALEQPVAESVADIPSPAREFLTDLLQGLSLVKTEQLTYARAALLWAQALRPENLKEPDFSQMLNKRFAQFHGAKEPLDDLEALNFNGSIWTGGRFKSGQSFTANTFLLGDKQILNLFKADKSLQAAEYYSPGTKITTDLRGQLSPLLTTRVICGGDMPLRIAIEEQGDEYIGLVRCPPDAAEADIRRQLERVLPFADYELCANESSPAGPDSKNKVTKTPLAQLPIKLGANLYYADGKALLPEMGAAGAAILAWTLFENLGNKARQEKE